MLVTDHLIKSELQPYRAKSQCTIANFYHNYNHEIIRRPHIAPSFKVNSKQRAVKLDTNAITCEVSHSKNSKLQLEKYDTLNLTKNLKVEQHVPALMPSYPPREPRSLKPSNMFNKHGIQRRIKSSNFQTDSFTEVLPVVQEPEIIYPAMTALPEYKERLLNMVFVINIAYSLLAFKDSIVRRMTALRRNEAIIAIQRRYREYKANLLISQQVKFLDRQLILVKIAGLMRSCLPILVKFKILHKRLFIRRIKWFMTSRNLTSSLSVALTRYLGKVKRCQRFIRDFLIINRHRVSLILMYWRSIERNIRAEVEKSDKQVLGGAGPVAGAAMMHPRAPRETRRRITEQRDFQTLESVLRRRAAKIERYLSQQTDRVMKFYEDNKRTSTTDQKRPQRRALNRITTNITAAFKESIIRQYLKIKRKQHAFNIRRLRQTVTIKSDKRADINVAKRMLKGFDDIFDEILAKEKIADINRRKSLLCLTDSTLGKSWREVVGDAVQQDRALMSALYKLRTANDTRVDGGLEVDESGQRAAALLKSIDYTYFITSID